MKNNRLNKIRCFRIVLLVLIILFGLLLRLYHLGRLPAILNRDEAALAYNGLLLSQTGRDEWEQKLPLALQSFGDYKLPGYPYLLAGLFKILPATDFVVRLPSVLAGVGLIFLAYFYGKKFNLKPVFSLLFSLLIALSPIFIFYSRMAWEANLALLFNLTAVLLLFDFDQNKLSLKKDLIATGLMLLAVFTYNSPLIYLPFLVVALPFLRQLNKPKTWIGPVLGLSLVGLLGFGLLSSVSSQKSGITIFTDETVWSNYVQFRQGLPDWSRLVIGNQYIYWAGLIVKNLSKSFSPYYLVIRGGGHPWHSVPGFGHLYWLVYSLGLVGLISLAAAIFNSENKKKKQDLFLLGSLFVSLLPALITVDAPHATRSLAFFFFFSLLAVKAFELIVDRWTKASRHTLLLFLLILGIETAGYFHLYFVEYPTNQQMYQPGYDVLIQELDSKFANRQIAVVDPSGYQYILTAWYLKIPPDQYFSNNIRQLPDIIGLRYGQQVKNYHFVAQAEDRSSQEQLLLYWDQIRNEWQIKTF
ncbi:MAG: phospholipid carrier-dependent glycosyltransferase [Candidatus Pacebacteria bacterium]|nr:phospholipid carrier-dependent glycosyltransferase [Candidatus Paceibacterota bacterium]